MSNMSKERRSGGGVGDGKTVECESKKSLLCASPIKELCLWCASKMMIFVQFLRVELIILTRSLFCFKHKNVYVNTTLRQKRESRAPGKSLQWKQLQEDIPLRIILFYWSIIYKCCLPDINANKN